jgi:hypothetical protein
MTTPVPLVLRLVTGEDIIADTIFDNEAGNSRYVISDPLKIVYLPATKETHISLSLMQWMFTRISDNQTFEMNDRNVLFTTEPSDSLLEYYYKTVAYFYSLRDVQKQHIQMKENKMKNQLYEDIAMSDEEQELDEMMDSDEMQELREFLEQLGKKDKDTLH